MSKQFRCIIVGGGAIGLITAHALTTAGIDWVLLERDETIIAQDTPCVVMYPDTLRVMDQLGLLNRLSRIKTIIGRTKTWTHKNEFYNTLYTHDWSMEKYVPHQIISDIVSRHMLTILVVTAEATGIFINHN